MSEREDPHPAAEAHAIALAARAHLESLLALGGASLGLPPAPALEPLPEPAARAVGSPPARPTPPPAGPPARTAGRALFEDDDAADEPAAPEPAVVGAVAAATAAPAPPPAVAEPDLGALGPEERERVRAERQAVLEPLEQQARACDRCALCQRRTKVAFSDGSPLAAVMFIGEAPGQDEDLQGVPFVGKAGQLLTRIIHAMGLRREDVYIANIIKCRPPGNRKPTIDEILQCRPYLEAQIEIVKPQVICLLGQSAAVGLGIMQATDSVGRFRGRFHDYRTVGGRAPSRAIPCMVTYHPAYLLRQPSEKRKVWEDVKKIIPMLSAASGKGGGPGGAEG